MLRAWLATSLLCLGGCAGSSVMPIGEAHEPRGSNYPIDLYMPETAPVPFLKDAVPRLDPTKVPADATVVGRTEQTGTGTKGMLDNARRVARRLGGNALVYEAASTSNDPAGLLGPAVRRRVVTFTILRYAEQPVTEAKEP